MTFVRDDFLIILYNRKLFFLRILSIVIKYISYFIINIKDIFLRS